METEKYINIIAEFEIKEDNKEIRIINSYEEYNRDFCLDDLMINIKLKKK